MTHTKSILVVGGGVAGMVAAIMLGRGGRSVTLVDADPAWRALGAGMTLNGGALRAFHQMGLLEEVKRAGWCVGGPTVCLADGSVAFKAPSGSPLGREIPGVGGIMRPVLHHILQNATKEAGVTVELGKRAVTFSQNDKEVTVEFADGSRASVEFVVGADGINSALRETVLPGASRFPYVGQGCWRAVVPRPEEVLGPMMFFGRQAVGVNPVSREKMYLFHLQHVADNRWMPEDQWISLLRTELEEFSAPIIRTISDTLNDASLINYRPLKAGTQPGPWYKGRVLLIGDAVHAPTPHSAYGAGLGIEDGIAIAEELEKADDLGAALANFMQRRFDRCKSVVDASLLQAQLKLRGATLDEYGVASRALTQTILTPF